MADAVADDLDLDAENPAPEGEAQKKRLSGKKLVLFVVLPSVVLIGGFVAAFLFGVFDTILGMGHKSDEVPTIPKEVVFIDLPEILVNLNTSGKQASYLKISIALEIPDVLMKPHIEALMPRVVDQFQVYLRELRREDLTGSAGLYRLKEELLMRVNTALSPLKINDVLFKEFIVQ